MTVKKPAGDTVTELTEELWNGTWSSGEEDFPVVSRIRDAKQGTVEVRSLDPEEKDVIVLTVRGLGDRTVVSATEEKKGKPAEEMAFFRAAMSRQHFAAFSPRPGLFRDAVKKGTLAGKAEDRKDGNVSVKLEQFGSAEAAKMAKDDPADMLQFFEPDPAVVFVRIKDKKKPQ